jgi:nicotinic acid mononucleotide adenylyltransferase
MSDYLQFLETLKKSGVYIHVACTGAGAGLQKIIADEPGISSVFVGSAFPYKKHETDTFLGFEPAKYVSEETAMAIAMESFIRAKTVAYKEGKYDQKCVGLGLTASIASENVHRGEHQIFCCTISDNGVTGYNKLLPKASGREARSKDDAAACRVAISELFEHLKNRDFRVLGWEWVLEQVFFDRPVFTVNRRLKESSSNIKFPGSFNPPHAGHFDMSSKSSAALRGGKVDYLINIDSPHKPNISIIECLCRVAAFRASEDFMTSANAIHFTKGQPLFLDKVGAYPTCKFIIGADTLNRILDPKWGPSPKEVIEKLPNKSLMLFDRPGHGDTWHKIYLRLNPNNDRGDGYPNEPFCSMGKLISHHLGNSLPISSTQIREEREAAKIQQDDLWPVP